MSADVDLVARVRALASVQAYCTNKRVYHQNILEGGNANFPCVAYEWTADNPFEELNGLSGIRVGVFTFNVHASTSAIIRAISADIQSLGGQGYTEFHWLTVTDTTDGYDPPIDLNESGLKFAQLTIQVVYEG